MRQFASQHLVTDNTQRINVGATVHIPLAHRLLRTHIRWRTDRNAGHREPRVAFGRAGNAEIRNKRAAGRRLDQNIVRLHVSVDHVIRMRIGERIGDFT